jgi:hypothetical protein
MVYSFSKRVLYPMRESLMIYGLTGYEAKHSLAYRKFQEVAR